MTTQGWELEVLARGCFLSYAHYESPGPCVLSAHFPCKTRVPRQVILSLQQDNGGGCWNVPCSAEAIIIVATCSDSGSVFFAWTLLAHPKVTSLFPSLHGDITGSCSSKVASSTEPSVHLCARGVSLTHAQGVESHCVVMTHPGSCF